MNPEPMDKTDSAGQPAAGTRLSFLMDRATFLRLRLVLVAIWGLVALTGGISLVLIHAVDDDGARDVGRFLSLGLEQTPGTWVASALLGLCAMLSVVGALEARVSVPRWARGWWLLAAVFGILSFDEVADVHGQFSPHVSRFLGDTSGVFTFAWIIPAIALGIGLLIVEGPFLRSLGKTGRNLVLAGVVFVAGAVGLEMIEGALADRGRQESLAYDVLVVAEELLEFGAVMWVITSLVDHLRHRLDGVNVVMLRDHLTPPRETLQAISHR